MVAGDTFMKYCCGLLPGCEGVFAFRHRPPHATWTRKIFGWPSVINPSVLCWGDQSFDAIHRLRYKKVLLHILHRGVSQVLHPGFSRGSSMQLPWGVCG